MSHVMDVIFALLALNIQGVKGIKSHPHVPVRHLLCIFLQPLYSIVYRLGYLHHMEIKVSISLFTVCRLCLMLNLVEEHSRFLNPPLALSFLVLRIGVAAHLILMGNCSQLSPQLMRTTYRWTQMF